MIVKRRVFAAAVLVSMAGVVQALPPRNLSTAAEHSATRDEYSLLVWYKGRVIFERGPDCKNPAPRIYSITKSLVSIGVFRNALSGGLSLGQPARFAGARGVTLEELLNQSSGLPPAHREFYSAGLRDKEAVLRRLKPNGERGRFVYGPSHWEVLAEEINQSTLRPLDLWLKKFVPGAKRQVVESWRRDDHGRLFFSTGARMDARDLLPAAREVLRGLRDGRGCWPVEVRDMMASGTSANRMYALGFWLNRGAGQAGVREIDVETALGSPKSADFWRQGCLSLAAPAGMVAMIGSHGQRVYIVPSQDLVVIRLGAGRGFNDAKFLRCLFGS